MSILPLLSLVLPGMCAMKLALIEDYTVQICMMLLLLAVPCVGDIFALFVGRTMKGPKLCPAVSPNKTISGAVGGLVGSLLFRHDDLAVGGLVDHVHAVGFERLQDMIQLVGIHVELDQAVHDLFIRNGSPGLAVFV
jgi:hypothetical protein